MNDRESVHIQQILSRFAGVRSEGQRIETAWLHPFPAKMPISVAEYIIKHFTEGGEVVLDPMVGSGTTIVAAQRVGRLGIGFDRDPLALLLSGSVTTRFNSARVDALRVRVLKRAENAISAGKVQLPGENAGFPREDVEFIQYWFPKKSQLQLSALAEAIRKEPPGRERDLAWVVFSTLVIAKSAGASHAMDIPRSRPHKRLDKPVVLPFDGWDRRFRTTAARLPYLDREPRAECIVQQADARAIPLEDNSVDLVVTSPPYLNAIDYLRAHKFSLVWMGHKIEYLRNLRGTMVGTERGLYSMDGLPPSLEDRLDREIEVDRRRALIRRYLSDMRQVVSEIKRVLRFGRIAFLVVGPTIISSRKLDAVRVMTEIGESIGMETVGNVVRKLSSTRRSLPFPSGNKDHPLAQRMRREVIVALRK